ncbi:MAG: penicillin-binding protein 1B, partial [Pseudomonadales bacterium]|nr:penicillin-binding protein 1B [Pseudomonadales bacterium]
MTRRRATIATRSASPRRPARSRRGLIARCWKPLAVLCLLGVAFMGAWFMRVDKEIQHDFRALQWALPARIYSRPLELYEGAHLNADTLASYMQALGYREQSNPSSAGEYTRSGNTVHLHTRGFVFWDGREVEQQVEAVFSGNELIALNGAGNGALSLVRLEPVEIAQINPATGEDRLPLPLAAFPQQLVNAVIAVEDKRFYQHHGIDPHGLARAMYANLKARAWVQGGSTLTQQLVKNLYLTQARTLRRKVEEAMMAVALELHFSKQEILTAYLNEVFLGQDGSRAIHGFALAAQYYFGRPLNELSTADLALLAGLSRGASYYNPQRNPERALARRDVVLASMLNQGYLTPAEHAKAIKETIVIHARLAQHAAYPAFMELVAQNLERNYNQDALRSEGLRIFTTLDIATQDVVDKQLDAAVKAVEHTGTGKTPLEAAVIISDANTGEIRALAGSRKGGGYTGFNRALQARRQIGSLVKPAVYLAALESGRFNLASVLSDRPVSVRLQNGDVWEPQNYERSSEGDVYFIEALQRSLNLATVDLGLKLGVENVVAMLKALGYSRPLQPYPSVLLGAVDMTPLEVAQIYQSYASGGFRSPPRAVLSVTTANGKPLDFYGVESHQVADPGNVFLLEHTLQGVFIEGTAKTSAQRLAKHLPLAGKTGTTNDLRDSWFAGFGGDLVGVVWLGYDDNRPTGLTGA